MSNFHFGTKHKKTNHLRGDTVVELETTIMAVATLIMATGVYNIVYYKNNALINTLRFDKTKCVDKGV